MVLQPFGPVFDVRSPWPPDQVKAAILKHKMPVFDRKNGARGWILGPVICLWWTPYTHYGPMLIGRIVPDGAGTRISGRAGSDLNGVAWLLFNLLMIPTIWVMVPSDGASPTGALLATVLLAALTLLVFRTQMSLHREADPLVRFLRKTAGPK